MLAKRPLRTSKRFDTPMALFRRLNFVWRCKRFVLQWRATQANLFCLLGYAKSCSSLPWRWYVEEGLYSPRRNLSRTKRSQSKPRLSFSDFNRSSSFIHLAQRSWSDLEYGFDWNIRITKPSAQCSTNCLCRRSTHRKSRCPCTRRLSCMSHQWFSLDSFETFSLFSTVMTSSTMHTWIKTQLPIRRRRRSINIGANILYPTQIRRPEK